MNALDGGLVEERNPPGGTGVEDVDVEDLEGADEGADEEDELPLVCVPVKAVCILPDTEEPWVRPLVVGG